MTPKEIRNIGAAAVLAVAMGGASAALAHHSFSAEFDSKRTVTVEGVITKTRITNPHNWLYLDVKNPDGTTTNWGFEFGTPISLKTRGIDRQHVKIGDPIKIVGYRAKNGGAFGYSALVTLADGRSVRIGSAPDEPTGPQASR